MADARIVIALHELVIEIEQDSTYPDQMTDMSNRALMLFMASLTAIKESGIDISEYGGLEYDGPEDAEEE
tara:strand:+ start:3104 stop:3313 length:210 start_codon:yes stop_codon:yes gene_type:complete